MKRVKRGLMWVVGVAIITAAGLAVGQVVSGVYNATPPTCTDTKPCAVQVDVNGKIQSVGTATVTGTVTANGGGTAGAANAGVLTVQGIASMTPIQVSQATAANLNATVTDGVGALNVIVDSGAVTVSQATAANLNAAVVGTGTAGAAAGGVLTVQGVASMTPVLVGDGVGAFNVIVDSATIGQLPSVVGQQASTASLSVVPYSTPAATVYMPMRMSIDGTNFATGDTTNGLAVDVTRVQGNVTVTDGVGALNVIIDSGTTVVTQSTATSLKAEVIGAGTAGSANAGVLTVQGITSMTPILATVSDGTGALNVIIDSGTTTVTQGTATSLKAEVIGAGTAGVPAAGILTVQGEVSMTPLVVSDGSGALNVIVDSGTTVVTQSTATNLNAAVVGTGTAGTPAGNILTVQGVTSMTPLVVSDGTGALNVIIDSGTTVVTQTTASSLNAEVVGDAAAGAAFPTNPVGTGLKASTSLPTAVDDADVVAPMADVHGRQTVSVGAPYVGLTAASDQTVDTTLTQVLTAPAAGIGWNITHISCTTATAAEEQVIVRTGTGTNCDTGTATIMQWNLAQDGGGFVSNFVPAWPVAVAVAVCWQSTSDADCHILAYQSK